MRAKNRDFTFADETKVASEPIFGVREFRVSKEGFLKSLTRDHLYLPDSNENFAQCDVGKKMKLEHGVNESIPVEECFCGWYVYTNDQSFASLSLNKVSAVVQMTGKIITYSRGVRAEHIEVLAISCDEKTQKKLEEKYTGIEFYRTRNEMLSRRPITFFDKDLEKVSQERLRRIEEFSNANIFQQILGIVLVGVSIVLNAVSFSLLVVGIASCINQFNGLAKVDGFIGNPYYTILTSVALIGVSHLLRYISRNFCKYKSLNTIRIRQDLKLPEEIRNC